MNRNSINLLNLTVKVVGLLIIIYGLYLVIQGPPLSPYRQRPNAADDARTLDEIEKSKNQARPTPQEIPTH